MSAPVLQVTDLTKTFGGFVALNQVNLHLGPGERLGLIGPNGSGKTTMINCITGALNNDAGSILYEGQEIKALPAYKRARLGIARSFQIPKPFKSMTVLENLCVPLDFAARDRGEHHHIHDQAMEVLQMIGFADRAHELSADQAGTCSRLGGQAEIADFR